MPFALAARMRTFKLILFTSICLSMLGGCVAYVEDDPAEAVSEVESAIIEVQPICGDLVLKLHYSEDCTTPRGDGFRECTDTITTHRSPVFKVTGFECKTTSTTITKSCGLCVVLDLPGDEPGDELPF